jgi:hypothetical protein
MLSHYRPKHLPTHNLLYQMNGNMYILVMSSSMDLGQGKRKTDGMYRMLCSLHLKIHKFKNLQLAQTQIGRGAAVAVAAQRAVIGMQNSAAPTYGYGYPPPMMQAQMYDKGKSQPAAFGKSGVRIQCLDEIKH